MVAKISTLGVQGIHGYRIDVECFLSGGLPNFDVVGLPDAAVKESRERIRAAARCCGYDFPARRIVMNLAPADTKKSGSLYDLPMLLSLLQCQDVIGELPDNVYFLGELSLEGQLRGGQGVLPMAMACPKGASLFVPTSNAAEAALCRHLKVYAANHVRQIIDHLNDEKYIPPYIPSEAIADDDSAVFVPDFADVRGQEAAKRALEIAAAGGHSVLLEGPPGAGKSMLTTRLPSILPPLSYQEALEVTAIYSVAGRLPDGKPILHNRPFRSPHHTSSDVSLVGGGTYPKPGEISLAHHGVLFLDELPEFSRSALEVLRQPLESGVAHISRISSSLSYPCRFMLAAAMNPCPCGFYGFENDKCTCSQRKIEVYRGRISGPLLDRLDLRIPVPPVKFDELQQVRPAESSAAVRERVVAARECQRIRFNGKAMTNSLLEGQQLRKECALEEDAKALLRNAFQRFRLSGRSHARILRVARTIADLDGAERIDKRHLAESLQFRGWGERAAVHEA
ncbi:MAG: YifB family Mg chelatase-like AAA ATPase [Oscillospiraceae bacterium]|nr:YifB family Mg chelatase-like AAA ATPase [Oscillospiraceae bacterium]